MKLSQLIEELDQIREADGDLEVQIWRGGTQPSPWTSDRAMYITQGRGDPVAENTITLFVAGHNGSRSVTTICAVDGETRIDTITSLSGLLWHGRRSES